MVEYKELLEWKTSVLKKEIYRLQREVSAMQTEKRRHYNMLDYFTEKEENAIRELTSLYINLKGCKLLINDLLDDQNATKYILLGIPISLEAQYEINYLYCKNFKCR